MIKIVTSNSFRGRKTWFFILSCLILQVTGCSEPDYKKEIEVSSQKSFFKVVSNDGDIPIQVNVSVKTHNNEIFDFNVIDSLSYSKYKTNRNPNDLIILCKTLDIWKLDTAIQIPKGKFLFGFENSANDYPIDLQIEMSIMNK